MTLRRLHRAAFSGAGPAGARYPDAANACSISANVRASSVICSGTPSCRAICDTENMPRMRISPPGSVSATSSWCRPACFSEATMCPTFAERTSSRLQRDDVLGGRHHIADQQLVALDAVRVARAHRPLAQEVASS